MSMISNSHAKTLLILTLFTGIAAGLVASCQSPGQARVAPDAPRPTPPPSQAETRPTLTRSNETKSVELKSVVVRRLDEKLRTLAGPEFHKTATEPLAIEVQTQQPLGNLAVASSPIIVFNDEK